MRNYKAKDVGSFIAGSAPEARPILKELRKITTLSVPEAEEKISWGVPFYWYHGALAGFTALKNHVDFGLAFVLQEKDRKMLEEKGYATGIKTIKIGFDQKVPAEEIRQILKAQAKINKAGKVSK